MPKRINEIVKRKKKEEHSRDTKMQSIQQY